MGHRPKIAVVGIGHELRGDDAAGVLVVRGLTERANLLLIDGGPAPENYTGALRRFQPDIVLLIDAAQMNLAAGAIRAVGLDSTDEFSASTHTAPLTLMAHFIREEIGSEVFLIGIQPKNTAFGAPISPEVELAVENVVQALLAASSTKRCCLE